MGKQISLSRIPSIALLLLAFALLGFTYNASTPVFEAPDEVWHYNYVRYVAEGHGLPALTDNAHGAYQEAAQPPLYYLAAALVSAPVSDDDRAQVVWHNPGFGYHAPGLVNDNKNMLVHTAREGWPWRGFTLALHLARLVSLAFGLLAVLATWGLARCVLPGRPGLALAAAGLVAFTPQFVFMSGAVSNDSAAAALSTASLWAIARSIRRRPSPFDVALTGLLIGLAWLTKVSTLLLLPMAGLGLALPLADPALDAPARRRLAHTTIQHLAILTGVALLTGGWWYARNLALYGDALGLSVHVNTPWGRPQAVSLLSILPELPRVYRSFWAAYGWGGIELPTWTYAAIGLSVLAALAGGLKQFDHTLQNAATRYTGTSNKKPGYTQLYADVFTWTLNHAGGGLLAAWGLALAAALLRWMTQVEAPHGRLLFPAIGACAVLLASGWAAWGQRAGRVVSLATLGLLGTLALISPFIYIGPALRPPQLLTEKQVQAYLGHASREQSEGIIYGGVAQLIGWQISADAAYPGDFVPVTLCWQAQQAMDANYTLFVHFLGQDNLIVGARDTWPGLGCFPTSLWPPGRPFCDVVRVQVEAWAPAPAVYAVEVGLYDALSQQRLEAPGPGLTVLGQVTVRGSDPPAPGYVINYDLGNEIKLIGYDLSPGKEANDPASVYRIAAQQPFSLTLHWQAQANIQRDYSVFVHVLDQSGQLVAQRDALPRAGAYPTSAWQPGETLTDTYTFRLPAGLYVLNVGMYHQPSLERLPVYGAEGRVEHDAIPVIEVLVAP